MQQQGKALGQVNNGDFEQQYSGLKRGTECQRLCPKNSTITAPTGWISGLSKISAYGTRIWPACSHAPMEAHLGGTQGIEWPSQHPTKAASGCKGARPRGQRRPGNERCPAFSNSLGTSLFFSSSELRFKECHSHTFGAAHPQTYA